MSNPRATVTFGMADLGRATPPPGPSDTDRMAAPTDFPGGPGRAALVLIHPPGPGLGRRHPVGDAAVTIGRDAGCDVAADHPSVSRRHARVERLPGGGYRVTDLGSTNGTFVNDARVGSGPLADGAYLRAGDCVFRFLADANPEAWYHDEVARLAGADPLTGLPNRRALAEALDRELGRAAREGHSVAVAVFDVDHFKAVNDRLGHPAGDAALAAVGRALRGAARDHEVVARYGGEEFVLVMPGGTAADAARAAERARRGVADLRLRHAGVPFRVTVSAGVADTRTAGPAADGLLAAADARLYEAKRAGRDRVCGG